MELMKILGLALTGVFLSIILKEENPAFAILTALFSAIGVLFLSAPKVTQLITRAHALYETVGGNDVYINAILKIAGVSCVTKIGGDICKDAGFSAVSSAVFIAGRILCITLCLPSLLGLFEVFLSVMP